MGNQDTAFICGYSGAARGGFLNIGSGSPLDFTQPWPNGATRLTGVDVAIDFCSNRKYSPTPKPPRRTGQLAAMYYRGHVEENFDQDSLPSPLSDLLTFSITRIATSHYGLAEWRWPALSTAYDSARDFIEDSTKNRQKTRIKLIDPRYSLGAGVIRINTKIINNDGSESTAKELAFVVTGATEVSLIEISFQQWRISLQGGVRLFAGQVFGIGGDAAIRVTFR